MFKNIPLAKERTTLQFRAEFFNIFNHPVFSDPATSVSSASFGRITSTVYGHAAGAGVGGNTSAGDVVSGGPRVIQLALKLTF